VTKWDAEGVFADKVFCFIRLMRASSLSSQLGLRANPRFGSAERVWPTCTPRTFVKPQGVPPEGSGTNTSALPGAHSLALPQLDIRLPCLACLNS